MIKIDKNTHLMILFTFALVFVSVYLYYVIVDVRKIQVDIKKLTEEAESRKVTVAKDMEALSNVVRQMSSISPSQQYVAPTPSTVIEPVCTMPEVKEIHPSQVKKEREADAGKPQIQQNIEDDNSVSTEDIRQTLDCESDGVDEIDEILQNTNESHEVVEEQVELVEGKHVYDKQDELHSMKYEELRDLCKSYGLSTKGTKEAIIKRLQEHFSTQPIQE